MRWRGILLIAVVVSVGAQAGAAASNHANPGPAASRSAYGQRTQSDPRNRAEVRNRATAPSARSAVTLGMQTLGVSMSYALHVASTLENTYAGNGEALVQLSKATASLATRWRAQGYVMGDVAKAFTDATRETKLNQAGISQVRTLLDGFGPAMTVPAANIGAAQLASPGFH